MAPGAALAGAAAIRATAVSGVAPILEPPSDMKVRPGETADQAVHATDADGDPLTFLKALGPPYMTVTTTDTGSGTATGNVHLAPPVGTAFGAAAASVAVSDGTFSDAGPFTIVIATIPPVLDQPEDMSLSEGSTADQVLTARDGDGDPLTFSRSSGPAFMTVTTTTDSTGNVHLAPGWADAGTYPVAITVSDGIASDEKSFQVIVENGNAPPTLDPITDMSLSAGEIAGQIVHATDPEGQPMRFVKDTGPAYMTVSTIEPGAGRASGNVRLAPTPSDAPTPQAGVVKRTAAVSVTDGVSWDVKQFNITVSFPVDHPPVLDQPGDMVVDEGAKATQPLHAVDPDGDWIYTEVVDGPPFMDKYAYLRVDLAPTYTDAGQYNATIRVTDTRGLFDEKSLRITVRDANAPPVLARPADMLGFARAISEQTLYASDVDGNPLTFSKVDGPSYMSVFTDDPGSGRATGIIRLAPQDQDVGRASGTVSVSDGVLTATQWWMGVDVHPAHTPALVRTRDICLHRGSVQSVILIGIDPDGDRLSFSQTGLPAYGTFVDNGDNTATLTLAPAATQAFGTLTMVVSVSDGALASEASIRVSVSSGCPDETFWDPVLAGVRSNSPPVAVLGGPYEGITGVPVAFDGSRSSEPDGQPLHFAWYLGDGTVASGPATTHTYARPGRYTVILQASDGALMAQAVTTATIVSPLQARAFVPGGRATIRLKTGSPALCVQIEPVGGSFNDADVDLSSIVMKSSGTGAVEQIAADVGKSSWVGDRDGNGIEEILACFGKEELRQLFRGISGRASVTVILEGHVKPNSLFRAPFDLVVIGGDAAGLVSSVAPNPMNPQGALTFSTPMPGKVTVRLYDVSGRLVRVVASELMPAGEHRLTIDGRNERGMPLSSGIYFYRVETPTGSSAGRFAVMR